MRCVWLPPHSQCSGQQWSRCARYTRTRHCVLIYLRTCNTHKHTDTHSVIKLGAGSHVPLDMVGAFSSLDPEALYVTQNGTHTTQHTTHSATQHTICTIVDCASRACVRAWARAHVCVSVRARVVYASIYTLAPSSEQSVVLALPLVRPVLRLVRRYSRQ